MKFDVDELSDIQKQLCSCSPIPKRHSWYDISLLKNVEEDAQDIQNMLDFLDSTTPFDTRQ
jgi:hypothetical protein